MHPSRRRCLLGWAALGGLVAGCGRSKVGSDADRRAAYLASPKARKLGEDQIRGIFGADGAAILRAASRVEAFRIVDPAWHRAPDAAGVLDGYPITGRGADQGADFAGRLAAILLDYRAYCFISPDCLEDPGVAFRAWDGARAVTLVICYQCYHLGVIVHDAAGAAVHRGCGPFAHPIEGPDRLRDLARRAFPTDPEIRALGHPGPPA